MGEKFILGISIVLLLSCSTNDRMKSKMVGKWSWAKQIKLASPPTEFASGVIEFTEDGSIVIKNDTLALKFLDNGKLKLMNKVTSAEGANWDLEIKSIDDSEMEINFGLKTFKYSRINDATTTSDTR